MPREEATEKNENFLIPTLAMSIPQFCIAHNISQGFYYKLKRNRLAPHELRLGKRTLITFEAAADWRRKREAKPATTFARD
ncbi:MULTISPECIES: hypothetical protein [unclassified Bradyrhizobium]|uniref:hypothetical protein n=1 Tax=unclassified Bradyrhizobium TaxID=2631580 RepID=UPI001CD302B1|nr:MULTISPECIES: hypothetical protein [unclassified Bradyrhizobium]